MDRSGALEVWRMPASGGEPEQVTWHGGQAGTLSADGAWLFYTKKDGADGLWRMPLTDDLRASASREQRLLDRIYRFNFAVAPTGVYFVVPMKADGTSSVNYLDLARGEIGAIKEVVRVNNPDLGLAFAPDGRSLLFTKVDYAGTDLMLVENFR